jgi:nucleoside-diphosphate-sugar epimerase
VRGEALTVFGEGQQTRSLCYVDDTVAGILAVIASADPGPINIGNPEEHTVLELAQLVLQLAESPSVIKYLPLPTDDPSRRCPDITRARRVLGWTPTTSVVDGLRKTIEHFRTELGMC